MSLSRHQLEVAQATYEEIRRNPKLYCIQDRPSSYNLPGIPILFGISGAGTAIDAHNRAVKRLNKQEPPPEYDMLARELRSTVQQNSKSENETFWILGVLSMGTTTLSAFGPKSMKPTEKKKLASYGSAIQKLALSMKSSNLTVGENETDEMLLAADPGITRLLASRSQDVLLEDALSLICRYFWCLIVGSLVFEFPTELKPVNDKQFPWNKVETLMDSYNVSKHQVLEWQMTLSNSSMDARSLSVVWNDISHHIRREHEILEASAADHTKARADLVQMRGSFVPRFLVCLFLKTLGHDGPMIQSLHYLDAFTAENLFHLFAADSINNRNWYLLDK